MPKISYQQLCDWSILDNLQQMNVLKGSFTLIFKFKGPRSLINNYMAGQSKISDSRTRHQHGMDQGLGWHNVVCVYSFVIESLNLLLICVIDLLLHNLSEIHHPGVTSAVFVKASFVIAKLVTLITGREIFGSHSMYASLFDWADTLFCATWYLIL